MATVVKIVATGREIAARRLKSLGTEPNRGHWGTGTTAPVDANTTLETPSAEAKVAGTSTIVTTTTTGDTFRVVVTLTSASTQTITEAGLFDSADAMYLRATFTGIPVESGDAIQFTIEGQNIAPV